MGEIVRLQKYIALCGAASRREAEKLIEGGQVTVNGETVTEMGIKVEIGADTVCLSGEELKPVMKKYYILLHKPAGFVTTVKDEFDRPTVIDLVKKDIKTRVVPVGRLDYDTEGLLLMTNDGDFSYKVSHPKFNMPKTYYAEVKGPLNVRGLQKLRRGVRIDDYTTSPAEVKLLETERKYNALEITIHEGRNRQVRKMFEAIGCTVVYLRRIKIGNVELGNVPLGHWRHLTTHEVNYLMKG